MGPRVARLIRRGSSVREFLLSLLLGVMTWTPAIETAPCDVVEVPRSGCRSRLSDTIQKHDLPGGMVAGIVCDGTLMAVGAAGVRKHGSEVPMTATDKLHLGSCTKAMTATLAATFVERGKLQWDAPLRDLLPDLEIHPDLQNVTFRQLLSHRAGLPRNGGGMIGPDWQRVLDADSVSDRVRRKQITMRAVRKPPLYPPGEKYSYSNLGYVMAGHILEEIADQPFPEVMQRGLFDPLEMRSAGFGPPGSYATPPHPGGMFPYRSWAGKPSNRTIRRRSIRQDGCIVPCLTGPSSPPST